MSTSNSMSMSSRQKRIFQETIKSARLGVPEAQYEAGLMYANGIGVTQNIGQAMHWVQQSAQRGFANAQYLLATRYETGVGVAQNTQNAMLWFGRAAEQSHSKAIFRLGKLHGQGHPEQAIALYRQAAEAGLAEAQCALARGYATGWGVFQDLQWALQWYQAAADQGLAAAQFALGELYQQGLVADPDGALALRYFRQAAAQYHLAAKVAIERLEMAQPTGPRMRGRGRKRRVGGAERRSEEADWVRAAEGGDADARFQLGQMYGLGLGLESDPEQALRWYLVAAQQGHARAQMAAAELLERDGNAEALQWYQRAADQGDAQAQFALGRMYCAGELLAPDFLRGMSWYVKAAEQGHALALVTLGNLFNSEMHHVAVGCYAQAAAGGSVQAQYLLGQQYATGCGVERHPGRAFIWYEKAASQGHAGAQCGVGLAYLNGLGVEKNGKLAFEWLEKAAAQGDAQAQWNLGALYAAGTDSLERDLKQALVWCQRSADQGFVAAQANLGILYALLGKPEMAVQCWSKAVAQNDPESFYNLGLAYTKGEGVEKDPNMAFHMLLAAAQSGISLAQSRVGLIYAMGEGVAQDPVEAHKWFALAAARGDKGAQANLARSQSLCTAAQVTEGLRRASEWEKQALNA